MIRPNSGFMMDVTAIACYIQNTSESDPACLLRLHHIPSPRTYQLWFLTAVACLLVRYVNILLEQCNHFSCLLLCTVAMPDVPAHELFVKQEPWQSKNAWWHGFRPLCFTCARFGSKRWHEDDLHCWEFRTVLSLSFELEL